MEITETENVVLRNQAKRPDHSIDWEMSVFCFIGIEIFCYLVQCRAILYVFVHTRCICRE